MVRVLEDVDGFVLVEVLVDGVECDFWLQLEGSDVEGEDLVEVLIVEVCVFQCDRFEHGVACVDVFVVFVCGQLDHLW